MSWCDNKSRRQRTVHRTDGLNNIRECVKCAELHGVDEVVCRECGWLLVTVKPERRAA